MITKLFRPLEIPARSEAPCTIRTSRSIHEVHANEDGTLTVSSYKLSNKWQTTPEELEELVAGWKSAKRVAIVEVAE